MDIILASGSSTRAKILDSINLKYKVMVSNFDEKNIIEEDPLKYVEILSYNKAKSVLDKVGNNSLVISADSIIYKSGKKYEKPKNIDEAINNLKELRNTKSEGITGVTVYDTRNGKYRTFSCVTDVYLKDITDEDIIWYASHESGLLQKAGYSIEGVMSLFVDKICGDYYNVLGLPLGKLYTAINELGYSLKDIYKEGAHD